MIAKYLNGGPGKGGLLEGLGLKLLIRVLLFSSLVTLVLTTVQLFLDYRGEIRHLERQFEDVEAVLIPSLAESLWKIDRGQVEILLAGLLHISDFQFVEIVEKNIPSLTISRGSHSSHNIISREIPIRCDCSGVGAVTLGTLRIEASLDHIYGDLVQRVFVILGSQGIKTFLVSFFLLFVFQRLVTRHLADAAHLMAEGGLIHLKRAQHRREDELDHLVSSYNALITLHKATLQKMEELAQDNQSLIDNLPANIVRLHVLPDGRKNILSMLGQALITEDSERVNSTTYEDMPELFHPDDHELLFKEVPRRLRETGFSEQRFRMRVSSGGYMWVLAREKVVEHLSDGSMITEAVSINITEQVEMRLAKEQSDRVFRDLVEALPVGVFVIDNDGKVMLYNEAAVAIWGRRPILGKPHWQTRTWCYPDGTPLPQSEDCALWALGMDGMPLPQEKRPLVMAQEQGRALRNVEMKIRRPDGTLVPVLSYPAPLWDVDGAVIGAFNVMVDIGEKEETRRELDLMSFALASIHEAVSLIDRNGIIIWANEWNERIYGYSCEELVGKNVQDLAVTIPGTSWEDHWRDLSEKKVMRFETLSRRKDGSVFPSQVHLNLFCYDGEEYNLTLLTDITEKKRNAEERALLQMRMEAARRLESLGQVAGGVAHDFNNLLGAILGFALFIAEDAEPDSTFATHARRIIAAGRRGKALVGQILTFSGGGETNIDVFPLASVVDDIKDILNVVIPSSTRIVIDIGESASLIQGDRDHVGQVVMNLVINANDSLVGRPGVVTVEIGPPSFSGEVERVLASSEALISAKTWSVQDGESISVYGSLDLAQPTIALIVEDHGAGMSEDVMRHIFTPFYTTKSPKGGTGLGLAVVQGIMLSMGGALIFESRIGSGTRVQAVFPLAVGEANVDERRKVMPRSEAGQLTGTRILLADDDVDFGDMLTIALERKGAEVASSTDPAEILSAIKDDPELWHVLITDQTMPGMCGTDLIRQVKSIRSDLPCILCTGYAESVSEEEYETAGVDILVRKPADIENLVKIIAEYRCGKTD